MLPAEMVRFCTAPSIPESTKEELKVALAGSKRDEPETMEIRARREVSSGTLSAYAHSRGSRGRVLLAALLCAAMKTPEALASSTLLTAPPTLLPAVQP